MSGLESFADNQGIKLQPQTNDFSKEDIENMRIQNEKDIQNE